MIRRDPIRTARLVLRPPRPDDAAAIFERYAGDADVTRYLIWRPHGSVAETETFLRAALQNWDQERDFTWVIERAADGVLLGMIGLKPEGHVAEIGYVLARDAWGQGFMTEALVALIDLALALPGMWRVWAACDVENGASARVMEKAGMQREGRLRRFVLHPNVSEQPRDVWIYARTR